MTDWEDFMHNLLMERFGRYQPPVDTEGQQASRQTALLREAWGRAKKEEPREDSA